MPANRVNQTMYVVTGNPATFNASSLYKPGELGSHQIDAAGKEYQLVQLDSGATSSTSTGIVATADVAFWKDRTSYIVTNDVAQAEGLEATSNNNKRNAVAGVFPGAITAGNYCLIQQRGAGDVLAASGGTYGVGAQVIANSGTVSDVTSSAIGTAPTHKLVGYANGLRVGTVVSVDLDLPWVP